MVERLLIAAGLLVAGGLAWFVVDWFQRRRMTRSFRQDSTAGTNQQHLQGYARILYFRSDACTSCETQSRLLQQLDDCIQQLIEKVDVDRDRERARTYNVLTLPTTLVVDAGGEVRHINYGVVSPRKLRHQVAQVRNSNGSA